MWTHAQARQNDAASLNNEIYCKNCGYCTKSQEVSTLTDVLTGDDSNMMMISRTSLQDMQRYLEGGACTSLCMPGCSAQQPTFLARYISWNCKRNQNGGQDILAANNSSATSSTSTIVRQQS